MNKILGVVLGAGLLVGGSVGYLYYEVNQSLDQAELQLKETQKDINDSKIAKVEYTLNRGLLSSDGNFKLIMDFDGGKELTTLNSKFVINHGISEIISKQINMVGTVEFEGAKPKGWVVENEKFIKFNSVFLGDNTSRTITTTSGVTVEKGPVKLKFNPINSELIYSLNKESKHKMNFPKISVEKDGQELGTISNIVYVENRELNRPFVGKFEISMGEMQTKLPVQTSITGVKLSVDGVAKANKYNLNAQLSIDNVQAMGEKKGSSAISLSLNNLSLFNIENIYKEMKKSKPTKEDEAKSKQELANNALTLFADGFEMNVDKFNFSSTQFGSSAFSFNSALARSETKQEMSLEDKYSFGGSVSYQGMLIGNIIPMLQQAGIPVEGDKFNIKFTYAQNKFTINDKEVPNLSTSVRTKLREMDNKLGITKNNNLPIEQPALIAQETPLIATPQVEEKQIIQPQAIKNPPIVQTPLNIAPANPSGNMPSWYRK